MWSTDAQAIYSSGIERPFAMADSGAALESWLVTVEDFFGAFGGLPEPARAALLGQQNALTVTCT